MGPPSCGGGSCRSVFTLLLLCFLPIVVSSDLKVSSGFIPEENMLHPPPMYMVVVPRLVRPGQEVNVYVSLFRLIGRSVLVSLSIRREQVEYAGASELFTMPGSKMLQMKMLTSSEPGNYTIRLEGTTGDGSAGVLFVNETQILFHPKRVSCFIQTDRPFYKMGHRVRFRVIAITKNQFPVKSGSITIYARDAKKRPMQRWVARNFFNGVYEGSFTTTHPMQYGWWTLEVHGWGYVYSEKFRVEAHFPELFYVNVSMPSYVKELEFALAGVITANLTHGKRMEGNATIYLDVKPPGGDKQEAVLKLVLPQFDGVGSFLFPLKDIAPFTNKLVGTQLFVRVVVHDFHFLQERWRTESALIYSSQVRLSFLGGHIRVFRPGVPLDVHVAVYETDGSRLSRRSQRTLVVEVTAESDTDPVDADDRRLLVVPDSSVVSFSLRPKAGAKRITVRVYYGDHTDSMIEMVATRHYTKSRRYLTVSSSTLNPEVDRYMVFTVRSSVGVPELHYMIISGGGILLANTVPMTSRQKTFSLALSRDMVPQARILVYCLLSGGEVLADSLSFHVSGMSANNVDVKCNKGKDFSGKTIEITARTFPGTFIAFSAMHYDLYKHGGNRDRDGNVFFTKNAVEEELATYDPFSNQSFSHMWLLDEKRREREYFNAPSHGIDANMTLSYSGVTVLTDALIPRIPAFWTCNHTLGFDPCFSTGCYLRTQRCDGVKQCADGGDEMGCPNPKVFPPSQPDEFNGLQRMWYYFDTFTAAWASFYTKPLGNIEFRVPMPTRPTTWLVGAFGLNAEHGLVFSHHPARLDTTRPFSITVDMASKAVRGEQLGVRVTAFNYWDRPIEAILTLVKSKKYAFVHVEDKGRTSSYKPRTSQSTVQTMVHLWPGDQRFVFFPVLPLVLGKVGITIMAESPVNRYTVTKTVTVRMDGVTNVYHTPYLINLVSQGSVIIPNMEIPIPQMFYNPELRQQLYVPGSAKSTVSVVGDVLGPGMFKPVLDQMAVTGFRDGHGHAYVFKFAVNLYWLQFLRHIKKLDVKTRDAALDGMILSLKSIGPYLRTNDGMAMRRGRTKDSLWLSAFALQSLAGGADPEWEDILFIDVTLLNKLALYMMRQQRPSGAFRWTTNVLDMAFDNHLFDEDGTPLNISLTAFAAISLAKSVGVLTSEAKSLADEAKDRAAGYLARHLEEITDPFQLCLVTYALYATDHRVKGEAFKRMRQAKRTDNYVYWSAVPIPPDPVEIINTVPFQFPRPLPPLEAMQAIHGTAYALLVYLINNRFEEAEPIMLWLQRQRYSEHGFAGAQATITALQALKEYGEHVTNRDIYRMFITLEATGDPGWNRQVTLDKGNFFQYLKFGLTPKKIYGSVRATARGTGLALLQLKTEVNVEYKKFLRSQKRPADMRSFDLDLDKVLFYGRNGSLILYNICMRWTRPDIAPTSGASVLEIDLPSGYFVLKRHVVGIVKAGPLNQHRPRQPWGKVIFYYDYIGTTRQCVQFRAERWYPVANVSIQHRVRVYDTFNPGYENTTLYTAFTLFHLHICQVCGSFQCPYCPFYNHGTVVGPELATISLLLASSVFVFLARHLSNFIT